MHQYPIVYATTKGGNWDNYKNIWCSKRRCKLYCSL